MSLYLNEYRNTFAETDDFRRCLEKASGFHLSRFFEDWFIRAGCPKIKVEGSQADDGYAVTIKQIPAMPKDEPFELSVTVGVKSKDGEWGYRTANLDDGQATLSTELGEAPEQVVITPTVTACSSWNRRFIDIYTRMVSGVPPIGASTSSGP